MDLLKDVVYFEVNNWFPGRDYPDAEPFHEWLNGDEDFFTDEYCKENKLVAVLSFVDMSVNYCIAAPIEWVEKNCPKLLNDDEVHEYITLMYGPDGEREVKNSWSYSEFVKKPYLADPNDLSSVEVDARFGYFLDYCEENFGLHVDTGEDYDLWHHPDDEEEDDE